LINKFPRPGANIPPPMFRAGHYFPRVPLPLWSGATSFYNHSGVNMEPEVFDAVAYSTAECLEVQSELRLEADLIEEGINSDMVTMLRFHL